MWTKVAKVSEFTEGQGRTVLAGAKELALFLYKGKFHALDSVCPHRGGPLGEGHLEDGEVVCPWHAWAFEVGTGKCRVLPGEADVAVFPVKVEGEDVLVDA
jgi:nitrite reductase (NADH) small subunit